MSLDQNFPQPDVPFVGADGKLTLQAIAFIRTLWSRTGYAPGVSSDDLALLGALTGNEPDVDTQARQDAQDAFLAGVQPPVIATDPAARSGASDALLTALVPNVARTDFTEPEMFALSLFGPLFAAAASAGGGLTPTGVTPGTYGDATNVGQFTVNAYGQITAAADVPISGSGGSTWFPMVDGAEPPAFITDGAGVLIAVAYAP